MKQPEPIEDTIERLAHAVGALVSLGRSLVLLGVVYLVAQILGVVIYAGGDMATTYSRRGTPFPMENNKPVYPQLWDIRDTEGQPIHWLTQEPLPPVVWGR